MNAKTAEMRKIVDDVDDEEDDMDTKDEDGVVKDDPQFTLAITRGSVFNNLLGLHFHVTQSRNMIG